MSNKENEHQLLEIQMQSVADCLARFSHDKHRSFLEHVVSKFERLFLQGTLAERRAFIKEALLWLSRKVRQKLLGRGRVRDKIPPTSDSGVNIAIQVVGGIGDFLIVSSFVQALHLHVANSQVDVFSERVRDAKFVFGNSPFVRKILPSRFLPDLEGCYDVVLRNTCQYVKYDVLNLPKICASAPDFLNTIAEAADRYRLVSFYHANQPWFDGIFARSSLFKNRNRYDNLGYLGNLAVTRNTEYYLCPDISAYSFFEDHIGTLCTNYITIHDGFDNHYLNMKSARATKSWLVDHWIDFVQLFKKTHPNIRVVQIGSKTSQRIPGVDVQLVGVTDLHESAWIIKHALLHVDTETGLIHLAKALHTKCVVIFGPTSLDYFAYGRNINLASSECSNCWHTTPDWMSMCPRGLTEQECMQSISPKIVLEAVNNCLTSMTASEYELLARQLYSHQFLNEQDDVLDDMLMERPLPEVSMRSDSRKEPSGFSFRTSKQWDCSFVLEKLIWYFGETARGLLVAELGAGADEVAAGLAKRGHGVHVFDTDSLFEHGGDAVDRTHMRLAERNGYSVQYGSLFNIPAEDEFYDAVICISLLAHVPYKGFALEEALRILKRGGILIVTFSLAPSPNTKLPDDLQKGFLTLELLQETLQVLSINTPIFSLDEVLESVRCAQNGNVFGIQKGITVGGMVIKKA